MRASTDAVARIMSLDSAKSACPLVAELSNHLKENSRSGIVSCLTRVKTDQKCFQRLLDNGGVFLLVELLRYRNVRVLDATLSILANACLNSNVRDEVQGTKIASYVVWILKNLQSGETMHCRACRLMGNLSESSVHARSLCEAGAIGALTETLRSSSSNAQTLGMAVRAVRNIWSIHEGSREDILEAGTIRAITTLLVQSRKRLLERSDDAKYVELSESCLKAMCVFVAGADPRSGEQMRGEKGLHGYRCIVDYCRANNKTAIKCLYKLCRNAERRPDLGCSGAIECLVEAVRGNGGTRASSVSTRPRNSSSTSSSASSASSWESLVSLCLFCREAVNRAKIRSGSGLEAILGRLAEVHDERYHPMLLSALAQFLCDDQSIAIMVKNGLVEVLVEKLKKMALETRNNEGNERATKNGKKRAADTSPSRQSDAKYNRTNERFGRFSLDYPRCDWSPGGTSNGYSSPPSTPPMSPLDAASDIDENADDNYSPICSDNEWLDNEDNNESQDVIDSSARIRGDREDDEEADFLESEQPDNFEDKYEETEEDEQPTSSSNGESREEHAAHIWTLALLSMLSYSSDPIDGLADPSTIQALVGYIATAKNHRAAVILARIVRNRAYFIPLLLQGFVFEAQTLYGTEQYTRGLCELAETGGAFGDLATILLRGQESQKLMVALSIPFVIKTREKLRILLTIHGGLDLIFRVLGDADNPLYDESILSICRLAVSLEVAGPETSVEKSLSGDVSERIDELVIDSKRSLEDKKSSSGSVTFELDDGSTVEASRTSLCEKSEVFSAMLEGSFNESGKSRVRLKKASNDGLIALLSAASGENGAQGARNIEALLDAVLLADQFLMTDVSDHLTETSIARLSHENLSRAWSWSRENSCHELQACCVRIFLTATMTRDQRLKAFRDFSQAPNFHDFVDDVRNILADSLAPSRR